MEGSDVLLFGVEETWGDKQPLGQYNLQPATRHSTIRWRRRCGGGHGREIIKRSVSTNQMSVWAVTANQKGRKKKAWINKEIAKGTKSISQTWAYEEF